MPQSKKFTATLPATPCTPAMRKAMKAVADLNGERSVAYVQRAAFTALLQQLPQETKEKVAAELGDLAHLVF